LLREAGFRGTLYFVHISTPEAVEIIARAREKGYRIVCGVTPHHILFDTDHMRTPESVVLKVNPPTRDPGRSRRIAEMSSSGAIDFLETDHAPHASHEKVGHPYLSGIRSLEIYDKAIERLASMGAGESTIYMITRGNILRVFRKVEDLLLS